MAERAFAMIREMITQAQVDGDLVDIGEIVTTVLIAFPDLDLTREDLTVAVANEASARGLPIYFSAGHPPDAAKPG